MAAPQGVKIKDHMVLALDIGSRFIKVAEMRLQKGVISLLNVAVSPTPPNLMDNNQVLDPGGLGRAIKSLLTTNKIRTRQVITSISGQSSVVVRPIDLPKMSVKELKEAMRFEVERHIPFTADEVVMDFAPIIDPDELPETESNMKVLLAVAQEDLIKAYLKVIKVAGLLPVAIDVEILSAVRALIDMHQSEGSYERTVALVNIGALSTDISVINKGNLIFTRSVPLAGDSLTEAVADQLGRSFEEAEELKKEYGRVFLGNEVESAPAAEPTDAALDVTSDFFTPRVGGETALPETSVAPPQSVFSLDEDTGMTWALTGNTASADAPSMLPRSHAEFEVDEDDVDDELPVYTIGLEEDHAPVPVFTLDDENVDDDIAIPGVTMFTPSPVAAATPAPPPVAAAVPSSPMAGPVFDLSSELESQMPAPLKRSASEPTVAEPAPLFAPEPAPAPAAAVMPPPAPSETPSLAATADVVRPQEPMLFFPDEEEKSPESTLDEEQHNELFQHRVFESMMPTLVELVTEIRRSFEYYTSREPDTPIELIVIYGGTSRLPNLAEFIQQEIGVDVQQGDPLMGLDITPFRQPVEYLKDLAPALPVCIGLGLRNMIA